MRRQIAVATSAASAASAASSTTTNSSPPGRATGERAGTQASMRSAAWRSSSSPRPWPRLSLTDLK